MPRAKDVISFVKFSILHAHRPHSAGGCYQTGFMKSGNLRVLKVHPKVGSGSKCRLRLTIKMHRSISMETW